MINVLNRISRNGWQWFQKLTLTKPFTYFEPLYLSLTHLKQVGQELELPFQKSIIKPNFAQN
jgi:hypothetical protein